MPRFFCAMYSVYAITSLVWPPPALTICRTSVSKLPDGLRVLQVLMSPRSGFYARFQYAVSGVIAY